ncbi:peptide-methionine (S)-S-oxide reductase MsrA [Pleionea sp. CnH1-48]|uniref:peptide-methionine (S)-S-oxide reductase MsrA n=1 Tax=Pleionea sp. CnH1-48 TaxID=2954494 RepID=UPI002096B190|nr:peptide-methionine (S)-S-oxide reductase MsrA [Pleionea sp. CnH1-48]MCO7226412.1 peptide-methionine (S)-S-oxide reductase MsrA [Pleionea sp. CnH1-48]
MSQSVVIGGGCFWCLEAVFQRVKGVEKVESGYAGGHIDDPDYRSVCRETTGHAEVVRLTYQEDVISLKELLDIFFIIHDPTTLNRQGNDVGTQYRSVIYFSTDTEGEQIQQWMPEYQKEFAQPITTEIKPLERFWSGESYHQNYYNNNSQQPYCQIVVQEKVNKLLKYFGDYAV